MSEPAPPPITEDEEEALDRLRRMSPGPEEETIDRLDATLRVTRLVLTVIVGDDEELYRGKTALLGMVARTHDLTLGAINGIASENHHVVSACLRGLAETVSAMAYVNEAPDRLLSLLGDESPSVGKLVAAGERDLEGLKSDYDWLSDAVHPGSVSLLAAFSALDGDDESGPGSKWWFSVPTPGFDEDEAQESGRITVEMAQRALDGVRELVEEDPPVLRAGRPSGSIEAGGEDVDELIRAQEPPEEDT